MKTIRQTATIGGATPHDIYETILDSRRHTKLSRQPTTVSRKVGGSVLGPLAAAVRKSDEVDQERQEGHIARGKGLTR